MTVDPQIFTDKFHIGKTLKIHNSKNKIAQSAENKTKMGIYKQLMVRLVGKQNLRN